MTSHVAEKPAQLWPEQWAIDAAVRAATIRQQVEILQAQSDQQNDPRRRAVAAAINSLLATTAEATTRGPWRWRHPYDRWRGTSVVRAYQSLHAAEIFLVDLLTDEQVRMLVPRVVARVQTVLDRNDPRRLLVDQLPKMLATNHPAARAAVQEAMSIGYEASDQLHVRVRNFRNILLVSAGLIAILMAGLVWLVSDTPTAMPLCFTPSVTAAGPAEEPAATPSPMPSPTQAATPPAPGATTTPGAAAAPAANQLPAENVCPSGDKKHPSAGDVAIVAGLGLLGGALAAAFSIRNIRGTSTPYDVPIALAMLKIPSGALTAVAGIVLLGGQFVPGLSELDNQRQILAYALVLGYAQQLATKFIDDRAHSLLDSLPSKDPEGAQPTPSAPPPTDPQTTSCPTPTAPSSTPPSKDAPIAPRVSAALRTTTHRLRRLRQRLKRGLTRTTPDGPHDIA